MLKNNYFPTSFEPKKGIIVIMDDDLKQVLIKYNQEHLLHFYDELEPSEKRALTTQIKHLDFNKISLLYENSMLDDSIDSSRISPIPYIDRFCLSKDEIDYYTNIGNEIIKNNKLAVITLAGGQGTRLGYKGPKGSYEIDVPPKKSLFEFVCDHLKQVRDKFGVELNWYIMTSPSNDTETRVYFEDKNFFGYSKNKINFFIQSTLPIIDIDGKIILDKTYQIKEGSNGNGDVFRAFAEAGYVEHLKQDNIDFVFIGGIDNLLLNPVDSLFLGLTAGKNYEIASKSLEKTDLTTSEWIFANIDNNPSIVDPKNLKDIYEKSPNGKYLYNQKNMLAHLFSTKAFEKLVPVHLPYHRAFKKNDFINEEGMKEVPSRPNSFKFEKFIFDSFKFFDKILLLQVKPEDEFAPIKSFTGDATPETALKLYLDYKKRL